MATSREMLHVIAEGLAELKQAVKEGFIKNPPLLPAENLISNSHKGNRVDQETIVDVFTNIQLMLNHLDHIKQIQSHIPHLRQAVPQLREALAGPQFLQAELEKVIQDKRRTQEQVKHELKVPSLEDTYNEVTALVSEQKIFFNNQFQETLSGESDFEKAHWHTPEFLMNVQLKIEVVDALIEENIIKLNAYHQKINITMLRQRFFQEIEEILVLLDRQNKSIENTLRLLTETLDNPGLENVIYIKLKEQVSAHISVCRNAREIENVRNMQLPELVALQNKLVLLQEVSAILQETVNNHDKIERERLEKLAAFEEAVRDKKILLRKNIDAMQQEINNNFTMINIVKQNTAFIQSCSILGISLQNLVDIHCLEDISMYEMSDDYHENQDLIRKKMSYLYTRNHLLGAAEAMLKNGNPSQDSEADLTMLDEFNQQIEASIWILKKSLREVKNICTSQKPNIDKAKGELVSADNRLHKLIRNYAREQDPALKRMEHDYKNQIDELNTQYLKDITQINGTLVSSTKSIKVIRKTWEKEINDQINAIDNEIKESEKSISSKIIRFLSSYFPCIKNEKCAALEMKRQQIAALLQDVNNHCDAISNLADNPGQVTINTIETLYKENDAIAAQLQQHNISAVYKQLNRFSNQAVNSCYSYKILSQNHKERLQHEEKECEETMQQESVNYINRLKNCREQVQLLLKADQLNSSILKTNGYAENVFFKRKENVMTSHKNTMAGNVTNKVNMRPAYLHSLSLSV